MAPPYYGDIQHPRSVYHVRRSSHGLHDLYTNAGNYYDGGELLHFVDLIFL